MKDLKLYLDKLRADSEHCITISQTALNDKKREVFEMLAATYQKLANDLEAVIATNAILMKSATSDWSGCSAKMTTLPTASPRSQKLLRQAPEESKQTES